MALKLSPVKRRRSPLKVLLVVLLGVAVLVGGATAAYAVHFDDRALPGVSIAGESVTGATIPETEQRIAERSAATTVEVTMAGHTQQFSLAELGYTVHAAATAQAAFAANEALGEQLGALLTAKQIAPVISFDAAALQATAQTLAAERGVPMQDAQIALNADQSGYEVTAAVQGFGVDVEALQAAAATAAETLTTQQVSLDPVPIDPVISTEQAQRLADAANALITLDIAIDANGELIRPWVADRVAWVGVPALGEGPLTPTLDEAAVAAWAASVAEANKIEATPGVRAVNSRGDVLSVLAPGAAGQSVNNLDAVTAEIVAALQAGTPVVSVFTFDKVEQTFEERKIAEGAENLVYHAAPGEKWIDLNLSNNTVTAYIGGTPVAGPWYIVPGMPGMETPTGKFSVYLKYQVQTMRGTNLDGTPYVAPNIPWVTYFTGPIAFHGAPWRDSFGWSGPGGSHGCVNMPVDAAQFIHGWAPMGTVVVSHY